MALSIYNSFIQDLLRLYCLWGYPSILFVMDALFNKKYSCKGVRIHVQFSPGDYFIILCTIFFDLDENWLLRFENVQCIGTEAANGSVRWKTCSFFPGASQIFAIYSVLPNRSFFQEAPNSSRKPLFLSPNRSFFQEAPNVDRKLLIFVPNTFSMQIIVLINAPNRSYSQKVVRFLEAIILPNTYFATLPNRLSKISSNRSVSQEVSKNNLCNQNDLSEQIDFTGWKLLNQLENGYRTDRFSRRKTDSEHVFHRTDPLAAFVGII